MSAKASGIVWESDLPRPEKYVLLALADHAKEDGSDVYPSLSRVEWKTGYSETQVRDIMNSLRKKHVLVLLHRGGKGPEDTHQYRIDLKALVPLPDFAEWKFAKMGAKSEPFKGTETTPIKGAVLGEKGCGLPLKKGTKTEPEPRTTRTQTVEPNTASCAEQSSTPPAITFPLNDGNEYHVRAPEVIRWREIYPGVDVMQELRNMLGWLYSHPRNRKTKSGVPAFINTWLSKEQNRAPRTYTNGAGTPKTAAAGRATRNVEALVQSSLGTSVQRVHVPDGGAVQPGTDDRRAGREAGAVAAGEILARESGRPKPTTDA